ncbi:MAG: energy transducer TonB [Deltaproteobacteria bacterium]|nr:energy transducer TonB [Deltaproteobacteria bacterium]
MEHRESKFWLYLALALAVHAGLLLAFAGRSTNIQEPDQTFSVDLKNFQVPESTVVETLPQPESLPVHPTPPEDPLEPRQAMAQLPVPMPKPSVVSDRKPVTPTPRRVVIQEAAIQRPSAPSPAAVPTDRTLNATADAMSRYLSAVQAQIRANKRYPRLSRSRSEEGAVTVQFRLHENGAIQSGPKVSRSSGHPMLDGEALRSVEVSAPYPRFPESVRKEYVDLEIVIVFRLEERS